MGHKIQNKDGFISPELLTERDPLFLRLWAHCKPRCFSRNCAALCKSKVLSSSLLHMDFVPYFVSKCFARGMAEN